VEVGGEDSIERAGIEGHPDRHGIDKHKVGGLVQL
jgi:hypothetical protein